MSYEAANEQLLIAAASESSNGFHGGMFELNAEFDADSLLYFLSHFECSGHTVHMLTQGHPPHPLISTVMSSSSTQAHSSPLPLAARLHRCYTNHSCYINNDLTFSRQTIYTRTLACAYTYVCINIYECRYYIYMLG